jgi:hypothetical protein
MGSFKSLSLKLVALVALLSVPALAADTVDQTIGPFGTVNNYDNPYVIGADKAQDALNVDVTPGGKSVKKRAGFAQAFALTVTTSAVHGVYYFYDLSGNDIALFFNDRYMTSSINGGTSSVLFSTGSLAATYQCVDSQGFAYCADTNRDPITKTNGSTYSQITPTNNGTMVAVTPDRLVLAGFSASPNRLDFSKAGDFTTWTPGGNPTDPNQITIAAPGSKITHITYAVDRLIWFKDTSFGYVLFGPTLADWVVRTVSPNVGTLDNSSVYWQGILYFRGQDGHIYSYDGANVTKLTRDIQTTISASQSKTSNSWTQTSQSDFLAGSLTNVDATSNPGAVQLSLGSQVAYSLFNGTPGAINECASGASNPYYLSGSITSTDTFILSSATVVLARNTADPAPPTFTVNFMSDSSGVPGSILGSTTYDPSSLTTSTVSVTIGISGVAISSGTKYWLQFKPNNPCSSVGGFQWWTVTTAGSNVYNGISLKAMTAPIQLIGQKYSSSGTYLSAVKNVPNLTSWDAFTATTLSTDGSQTFSIRAATNSFTVSSSTPSWSDITAGNVPTVSTGTFFQIRDVFATTSSSETPVLSDFTQKWFEGSASDKAYATYFKDAIWWAVASGAGATTNNKILRYDLLNQGWLLYDIPMDGMYVKNQSLYFGSATSGTIYKFGDVNNDAGAAINAYWKSKDFFVDSPFTDKELGYISTVAGTQTASTMTITYTLSGNTSTSYSFPLNKSNSSFAVSNKMIPTGKSGRTVNIQFGNNAADQPFEVFGIQFGVRPKPWNASNQ